MRAALMAGLVAGFTVMAGAAPAFAAGNPSGTGLPSQSCQDIVAIRPLSRADGPHGMAAPTATNGCLGVRFAQRVDVRLSRSEALRGARG